MDFITADEAADVLNVSRRTIIRWATEGRLPPAYRAPGPKGIILFHRQLILAVRAWADGILPMPIPRRRRR